MTKRRNRTQSQQKFEAIVRRLASTNPYIAATYSLYVDGKYSWTEFLIASIELLAQVEKSLHTTLLTLANTHGIEIPEPEDFTIP
jgi:hypothetical protein